MPAFDTTWDQCRAAWHFTHWRGFFDLANSAEWRFVPETGQWFLWNGSDWILGTPDKKAVKTFLFLGPTMTER